MKADTREKLYRIIFESETKAGKRFDIWLLWLILGSVMVAMLDSVPSLHRQFENEFYIVEWGFTVLFTLEYLFRIYMSPTPSRYILSYWGLIDLVAILPTYLSLLFLGSQYLLIVRILRLLRVFRILRLVRFTRESLLLIQALKASFFKISIFLMAVLVIVVLLGTVMYVVEGGQNGFNSIPQSIYWAIITVTTVGYGDIVPFTVLGKFIASVAMIIGYAIIAVPTGIVTVEMAKAGEKKLPCPGCGNVVNKTDNFCNHCGASLSQSA
jgi:voltage-gated potassium channel